MLFRSPCCIAIFIAPAVSTAALPVSSGADQSANPAQITSGTSEGAALANGIGSAAAGLATSSLSGAAGGLCASVFVIVMGT